MDNFKDMMKKLPSNTNDFNIMDIEGLVTKHKYSGNFVAKVPNLRIQAQIAKFRGALNGGDDSGLDLGTRNLHHMIAYLKHVLTEFPKWWEESDYGYELYDINVIEVIYDKAIEQENAWVEAAWGKKSDGKEESKEG